MAIYEFFCRLCDTKTRIEKRITDELIYPKCPECGKEMGRRFTTNIIAMPFHLNDEINPKSELDDPRHWEKQYEKNWTPDPDNDVPVISCPSGNCPVGG